MERRRPMQRTVLCVDDKAEVLSLLQEMVTALGYKAISATDGLQALERLKENDCDILITDIRMPRMDGIELIKRVVADFPGIDIIAITGYSSQYTYNDLIDLGASDFISKPFRLGVLEAKLNRIIRERDLRAELERLSNVDGLTGLFNRRYFDETLRREASRAILGDYDVHLLIIDMDKLKFHNDTFGHERGDSLIRALAQVISENIRKDMDSACRIGGDEFAVLLPQTDKEGARTVAERIRTRFRMETSGVGSVSIGIAKLQHPRETLGSELHGLVERADRALYVCKANGGDQVREEGDVSGCIGPLPQEQNSGGPNQDYSTLASR